MTSCESEDKGDEEEGSGKMTLTWSKLQFHILTLFFILEVLPSILCPVSCMSLFFFFLTASPVMQVHLKLTSEKNLRSTGEYVGICGKHGCSNNQKGPLIGSKRQAHTGET